VSADGRVVVFRSVASNLAPGGGSLFAWDRVARSFTALAPTANGNIFDPAVSSDARFVAFETSANNLAPGADSQFSDVLRLDRQSGEFRRASQGFGGVAANGGSATAGISGDGRYVVFTSFANNLVSPATTANRQHVYIADYALGTVELVSRAANGAEGGRDSAALEAGAISADGRRIVFASEAENLAPVFAGNVADVIVRTRDPQTGAITFENANRSASGEVGTLSSSRGSISPNGRFVVFRSNVANVLPGGVSPSGLLLRDLDAGTIAAVPAPPGFPGCARARVADNGDVVMQCAPSGQTTALQVFVARRVGGIELASPALAGGPGNGSAGQTFAISADARLVAFESAATNHLLVDANNAGDVFVRADAGLLDTLFADGFE
jgi:Tol biopolymer transport system component